MVTKNFLFIFASLLIAGCSTLKTRDLIKSESGISERPQAEKGQSDKTQGDKSSGGDTHRDVKTTPLLTPEKIEGANSTEYSVSKTQDEITNPKIGLILGPGAFRTYAEVGVVQELVKAKLPITHVVGIEMGALVGSIYSAKGLPYDVEWQMFKLKDVKSISSFLTTVFSNQKTEDFKVPFACPAYNLTKQQNFMMSKGTVTQMIPYCLSAPPAMKPYMQNVASLTELKSSADYLRGKGANYIVYVNVLSSKNGVLTGSIESENNIFWSLISQSLTRQWPSVDYVINVPVQDFELTDFSKRREILQRGIEAGQVSSSQISKKLGL